MLGTLDVCVGRGTHAPWCIPCDAAFPGLFVGAAHVVAAECVGVDLVGFAGDGGEVGVVE